MLFFRFFKKPIRLISTYSFSLGCDLRDRQIMVYKPQSMSAVDLFRHISRQPSLHLCQAIRTVIMLMKRCPQENARYGEKWSVGNFTGKWRNALFRKDFIGLCSLDQIQRNQVLDSPLEIAHGHSFQLFSRASLPQDRLTAFTETSGWPKAFGTVGFRHDMRCRSTVEGC